MYLRLVCSVAVVLVVARLSLAVERHDCPASSCPKPQESLDLSPLQGLAVHAAIDNLSVALVLYMALLGV